MKRILMYGVALVALAGCGVVHASDVGPQDVGSADAPATDASVETFHESPDEGSAPEDVILGEAEEAALAQAEALTECGLEAEDIAYMERDWERVIGSIGRMDHSDFTQAFVVRLGSLRDQGSDCPASQELGRFIDSANLLHAAASEPVDDNELYRRTADSGNEWLDGLAITADKLAAG